MWEVILPKSAVPEVRSSLSPRIPQFASPQFPSSPVPPARQSRSRQSPQSPSSPVPGAGAVGQSHVRMTPGVGGCRLVCEGRTPNARGCPAGMPGAGLCRGGSGGPVGRTGSFGRALNGKYVESWRLVRSGSGESWVAAGFGRRRSRLDESPGPAAVARRGRRVDVGRVGGQRGRRPGQAGVARAEQAGCQAGVARAGQAGAPGSWG